MTTLRWPRRGVFRDASNDVVVRGPDGTIDIDDPDRVEHYLDRGFEQVDGDQDGSAQQADAAEGGSDGSDPQGEDAEDGSADGSAFDVDAFLDRTPVSDVADDIADGQADDHLGAVEDAASRTTVTDAVEARRAELNDAGD